jgi:hypothetical protein
MALRPLARDSRVMSPRIVIETHRATKGAHTLAGSGSPETDERRSSQRQPVGSRVRRRRPDPTFGTWLASARCCRDACVTRRRRKRACSIDRGWLSYPLRT